MPKRLLWLTLPVALATMAGCARTADKGLSTLSVTSTDPLTPRVGETVTLTVRAIMGDGTSTDVTDRATCALSAEDPPGTLDGRTFTATKPGTTDVACTFQSATGTVGITVPGQLKTTVAKIQSGALQAGTAVEVTAVVFGLDPEREYQNFWAQDEGGGPKSGIYFRDVRDAAAAGDGGAAAPPPIALEEGDVVTVTGTYVELRGRSVVSFSSVKKVGRSTPKVSAVAVGKVDAATWDGCLVQLDDVVVTEPSVNTDYWQVAPAQDEKAAPVLIDTLLYDPAPAKGQRFAAVVGVVFPSQPKGGGPTTVAIVPRREADLRRAVVAAKVPDIQSGAVPPGTDVVVEDLVVTGVDVDTKKRLVDFFAQSRDGGTRSGLYFRDLRKEPGDPVAIGDVVKVTGELAVKNGRKVVNYTGFEKTGAASAEAVTVPASADLAQYESMLVRVANVKVTNAALGTYAVEVQDNAPGGTAKLRVSTWLHELAAKDGDILASVRGVVDVDAEGPLVMPRDAADLGALGIRDILAASLPDGSLVRLPSAVVTAVRPGSNGYVDFWVQDEGGGPRSGLQLRDDRAAGASEVVTVGDLVRVEGTLGTRNGSRVLSYTELARVKAATPIADDTSIDDLLAPSSPWDGCLVTLSNVTVRDVASYRITVARDASAGAAVLDVRDDLFGAMPALKAGQPLTTLRGVVYRSAEGLELWPRASEDVVP